MVPRMSFETLLSVKPWHDDEGLRKLKLEQEPGWKVENSTFDAGVAADNVGKAEGLGKLGGR